MGQDWRKGPLAVSPLSPHDCFSETFCASPFFPFYHLIHLESSCRVVGLCAFKNSLIHPPNNSNILNNDMARRKNFSVLCGASAFGSHRKIHKENNWGTSKIRLQNSIFTSSTLKRIDYTSLTLTRKKTTRCSRRQGCNNSQGNWHSTH